MYRRIDRLGVRLQSRSPVVQQGSKVVRAVLAISAAAVTWTCTGTEPRASEDPCDPNYAGVRYTVIGPDGGFVTWGQGLTVGDEVRLVVPPGAWGECWEVRLEADAGGYNTPWYPAGFVPSEYAMGGSVAISIYRQTASGETISAPDSMYFELSFPTLGLPEYLQRPTATFYYDSTAWDWRILPPHTVDANFVTVRASNWRHPWWFGRIDLGDVDFERYMSPALEQQIGTETWNQIMATMDSVYYLAEPNLALNCLAANIVQGLFQALSDNGAAGVRAIQSNLGCGSCDALSTAFWDEFHQYIDAENTGLMIDLLASAIPGEGLIYTVASEAISFIYDLATSGDWGCDFDCYFDEIPKVWYLYMAEYYAGKGLVSLAQDFKTTYLHCAPAPPKTPGFSLLPASGPSGGRAASLCTPSLWTGSRSVLAR